jgi:Cu/Zn superoxide dismutase
VHCHLDSLRKPYGVLVVFTLALAGAASIAGCANPRDMSGAAAGRNAGLVANLRGVGSAMSGKVRVVDRGDGVSVSLSAINLPQIYRVAFHQNGNCSSPNGFSAGPAWAPAGLSPTKLAPLLMNSDGNGEAEFHVSGVHTTGENGLAGRSVLFYFGYDIEPVKPDVRNNVVACGVFEPAQILF